MKPMADIAANNFSFSCLIQISGFNSFSTFYLKLLILILSPVLLVGILLAILTLKYRRNLKAIKIRTTAGVLLVLFFIHASITAITFQTFLCKDIEGQKWLVADLHQQCWTGLHLLFSILAAIGAAVWSLGIPLGTWAILYEEKLHLKNREVLIKYGFLYKGFRPTAYYWESVIMLRKVSIIFVGTLLSTWGEIVQAYILLFLLFFFGIYTAKMNPYLNRTLNYLEMFSLFSTLVSAYLGLFFLTSTSSDQSETLQSDFQLNVYTLSEWIEWSAFALIILSNFTFIVLWIWFAFSHLASEIRQKYPRLYFVCFMCCRKQLLEEDLRKQQSNKKNESYIKEVENLRNKLVALQTKLLRNKQFVTKGNIQTHLSNIRREIDKIDLNALPIEDLKPNSRIRQVQGSLQQFGELSIAIESELNITTDDGQIEFREIENRVEESTSRPPSPSQQQMNRFNTILRPGITKKLSLDLRYQEYQEKQSCNALQLSQLELDHNIEYEYKKSIEMTNLDQQEEPEVELKRLRSEKLTSMASERPLNYGETNEVQIRNIIANLCDNQEEEEEERG